MLVCRDGFYPPKMILEHVRDRIEKVQAERDTIDYLTFVSDGEPSLDVNLGREIEKLGSLGIKTAVITNSSLIWREDVRRDLSKADWVSVKVDTVREDVWHRINRPHGNLDLQEILDGLLEFSKTYSGVLCTETMLVRGLNDDEEHAGEIARYISGIKPAIAYLSIPIRPTAVKGFQAPGEQAMNRIYQDFTKYLSRVEYLIGYEGNDFACSGDIEEDLLGIAAVHPMREDAVMDLLKRSGADDKIISRLTGEGKLTEVNHEGKRFYLRKYSGNKRV
jgi:wyosine [tRNA(Phe)-imidazoG37] synthetase (radical SAM superfamily)